MSRNRRSLSNAIREVFDSGSTSNNWWEDASPPPGERVIITTGSTDNFTVSVPVRDTQTGEVSIEYHDIVRPVWSPFSVGKDVVLFQTLHADQCLDTPGTYSLQRNGNVLVHLHNGDVRVLLKHKFLPRAQYAGTSGVCLVVNGKDTKHRLDMFDPVEYAYNLGMYDAERRLQDAQETTEKD